MIHWRKLLAGGLTTAICLFGLGATAAAAPAAGHDQQRGDGNQNAPKQQLEDSKFDGQEGPDYDGRKASDHPKLDKKLNERADKGGSGKSRAIVVLKRGCDPDDLHVARLGGRNGRGLGLINGFVVELPNFVLRRLADNPCVAAIHWDRQMDGEMNRAAIISGARAVQQKLGFDGAGIGVAVIDSGVTSWHDDLTYQGSNPNVTVVGGQRVAAFVDFVNGRTQPYDDNGHGSHVAGIIAGNGYDTAGARAGIAPAANLVSLKVLDDHGGGYISNVIAGLDWVVVNHTTYNIRVVNLSVGAAVTESFKTDPLTLAAKRCVDAGIVVVTAAGNLGKNPTTLKPQYGAITSPGNAPWVLTVGAYSHEGTLTRLDDKMAAFSSHGPTAKDYLAKPDVVALGVGIVSLSAQASTMFTTRAQQLMIGSLSTTDLPYLSLSGTSMASPMVAGTVALMLQANPNLTPNLVKAIIEYTAQDYNYDVLTQGAGFLNTKGAVDLAQYFHAAKPGQNYPHNKSWGKTIVWGNRRVNNGVIKPGGSAWAQNIVWGATKTPSATNIVWGTSCAASECDNIVWGTSDLDSDNIVSGTVTAQDRNIVWGTALGELDNIVWGTACGAVECDNIVWGTECGLADCDNIVWGTSVAELDALNIVWGTALELDNIVWGTAGEVDNIVWGTSTAPDSTWGSSGEVTPVFDDPAVPGVFDATTFDLLFDPPAPVPAPSVVPDPSAAVVPNPPATNPLAALLPAAVTPAPTTTPPAVPAVPVPPPPAPIVPAATPTATTSVTAPAVPSVGGF